MTVACVLRSGGDFDACWVQALKAGVDQYAPDAPFVCLADMDVPGICVQPLVTDWPGWWAKLELFRPGRFDGPVLYMDLDSLPVGSLDDLATYHGPFAMINDFYRGRSQAQSGVMLFTPSAHTEGLYAAFRNDAEGHMKRFRGDGEWLDRHTSPDRLQDLYPGQIVSLKAHAKAGIPENARLVCGHGRPRFTDPKAGWAHALWSERAA